MKLQSLILTTKVTRQQFGRILPLTTRVLIGFEKSHNVELRLLVKFQNVTSRMNSTRINKSCIDTGNNEEGESFRNHSSILNNYPTKNASPQKRLLHFNLITPTSTPTKKNYLPHEHKSIPQIFKSLIVFHLCKQPYLIQHADQIIDYSNKVFGQTITNSLIRHTFFAQFCAGENENDILPILHQLKQSNVGAILDYAAEDDDDDNDDDDDSAKEESILGVQQNSHGDIVTHPPFNQPARIYKYQSEQKCDHHVEIFLKCIHAVQQSHVQLNNNSNGDNVGNNDNMTTSTNTITRAMTPPGFAAVKVTALGNPLLLERMSTAIIEGRNLFSKFDYNQDGHISREEFTSAYTLFFNDGGNKEKLSSLLDELDPTLSNHIDYITFMSKVVTLENLPYLCSNCKAIGPLSMATPSKEEFDLLVRLQDRMDMLAREASNCGVQLLIDAEQSRYQPAIDNLVHDLQKTYNDKEITNVPIIFNTYQAYLKDSIKRVEIDLERSIRLNYHFGAKLVRGAYMITERSKAKEMNQPSLIHPTIIDTHNCYNNMVELLLKKKVQDPNLQSLQIMCATHNEESIQKALELMDELGLHDSKSFSNPEVHFAQLYGMSDNLTFPLGQHNYSAFKYVPYGKIDEVMPYLLRRAQENSDVFGNASKEVAMCIDALKKRTRLF
jgi:proline dehydrogenase